MIPGPDHPGGAGSIFAPNPGPLGRHAGFRLALAVFSRPRVPACLRRHAGFFPSPVPVLHDGILEFHDKFAHIDVFPGRHHSHV